MKTGKDIKNFTDIKRRGKTIYLYEGDQKTVTMVYKDVKEAKKWFSEIQKVVRRNSWLR